LIKQGQEKGGSKKKTKKQKIKSKQPKWIPHQARLAW
jgi:hypothetical protein